jgi:hypothetical protein
MVLLYLLTGVLVATVPAIGNNTLTLLTVYFFLPDVKVWALP